MEKNDDGIRKVLLITDLFPPQKGGRSEKIASRVEYLVSNGWKVFVIAPKISKSQDQSLNMWELDNLFVFRTHYFLRKIFPNMRRNLAVHDGFCRNLIDLIDVLWGYIRWVPFAIQKGIKVAKEQKINVIYSLNNPITNHIIALVIKRITRTPWLVEYRDPIVGYLYNVRGPEFINKILEYLVLQNANKVIWYSTLEMEDNYFSTNYPDLTNEKFFQIPYFGFNENEFVEINRINLYDPCNFPMIISYTGVFYQGGRSPGVFLKSLSNFVKKHNIDTSELQVKFAGDWSEEYTHFADKLELNEYITYLGYISREECIELWGKSHVLLLLGAAEGLDKNFPSKFWDYIGSKRVILGLVSPKSDIAEIIERENLGVIAHPLKKGEIENALFVLYQKFLKNDLNVNPTANFLELVKRKYAEEMFEEKLAQVIKI